MDRRERITEALPERGRIGILNRSHDEEIVALRVHPEWTATSTPPEASDAARAANTEAYRRLKAEPDDAQA